MKVLIAAPINPHSGYGNDGIGLALALRYAGCDVYLDPMHVQAPLPMDVAELFTKRLQPPFDLYLRHADPSQLVCSEAARKNSAITLGMTMWEMTSLDNMPGRSKLRKQLKGFDLVVGYDEVSTGALAPYVSGQSATVQGGYWPRSWPERRRDWNAPTLNFCMVGALGPRKDPFVAIEAFRRIREKHPDVNITLSIKTVTPGLHSALEHAIPGLTLYYEVWPEDVLREFYYSQHVLIAPSRGEGKNMPALEMLSTGGTVIATDWGGHKQWLSPAYGYPLGYHLEPVRPDLPGCLWAKAQVDHLEELMLHAYHNRQELARKGELAAQVIPQMCSWEKVIDRLMDRVAETGETGERVVHKYRVAKARADDAQQLVAL